MSGSNMIEDPLDSLLDLEEDYYQEGYRLGEEDGSHAGYVEGRLFGIEKGYEKALEMGKLHGRALVWKHRFGSDGSKILDPEETKTHEADPTEVTKAIDEMPKLQDAGRLTAQVEQLLSITDPHNLSTGNDDDSVNDFDERLKKAAAKIKIISRMIGEPGKPAEEKTVQRQGDGTGNIEDLSSLSARH